MEKDQSSAVSLTVLDAQTLFDDQRRYLEIIRYLANHENIGLIYDPDRAIWYTDDGNTGYEIGQGTYNEFIDAFAAVVEHLKGRKE